MIHDWEIVSTGSDRRTYKICCKCQLQMCVFDNGTRYYGLPSESKYTPMRPIDKVPSCEDVQMDSALA